MADKLDDDYVASILEAEAKSRTSQYSQRGLNAFLPTRARDSAPKPNTRFLKNLVRDVDSHNAALLAEEAAKARSRLKANAIPPGRDDTGQPQSERHSSSSHHHHSHHSSSSRRSERDRHHYKSSHRSKSPDDRHRSRRHRDEKRHRSRSRSRSKDRSRSPRRRSKSRDRGKRRRKSHSRERRRSKDRRRHDDDSDSPRKRRKRREASPKKERRAKSPDEDSSDPLEDIIGPPPPPRARGRGIVGGASSMDRHFNEGYDPTIDVQPPSDEEAQWENAVEVFRDRVKWKQQGAERLRSAGFDEEFITAWEQNKTEDETKLKWAKKGATREWDRGKVMDDETGIVETKASWTK